MTYKKWRLTWISGRSHFGIIFILFIPFHKFILRLPRIITHAVQNAFDLIQLFRCQIRCAERSYVFFNLGYTTCTNQGRSNTVTTQNPVQSQLGDRLTSSLPPPPEAHRIWQSVRPCRLHFSNCLWDSLVLP